MIYNISEIKQPQRMAVLFLNDLNKNTSINILHLFRFISIFNKITQPSILLEKIKIHYDSFIKFLEDKLNNNELNQHELLQYLQIQLKDIFITLNDKTLLMNNIIQKDVTNSLLTCISSNISIIIDDIINMLQNNSTLTLNKINKLLSYEQTIDEYLKENPDNIDNLIDIINLISNSAKKNNNPYISMICKMFVNIMHMNNNNYKIDLGQITLNKNSLDIQYHYDKLIDITMNGVFEEIIQDIFSILNTNDKITLKLNNIWYLYTIYSKINEKIMTKEKIRQLINVLDQYCKDLDNKAPPEEAINNIVLELTVTLNKFYTALVNKHTQCRITSKYIQKITDKLTKIQTILQQQTQNESITKCKNDIIKLKKELNELTPKSNITLNGIGNKISGWLGSCFSSKTKQNGVDDAKTEGVNNIEYKDNDLLFFLQILQDIVGGQYGKFSDIELNIAIIANSFPDNIKNMILDIFKLIFQHDTITNMQKLFNNNADTQIYEKISWLNLGQIQIDDNDIIIKYNSNIVCKFSKHIIVNKLIQSLPTIFSIKDIKITEDIDISTLLLCYSALNNIGFINKINIIRKSLCNNTLSKIIQDFVKKKHNDSALLDQIKNIQFLTNNQQENNNILTLDNNDILILDSDNSELYEKTFNTIDRIIQQNNNHNFTIKYSDTIAKNIKTIEQHYLQIHIILTNNIMNNIEEQDNQNILKQYNEQLSSIYTLTKNIQHSQNNIQDFIDNHNKLYSAIKDIFNNINDNKIQIEVNEYKNHIARLLTKNMCLINTDKYQSLLRDINKHIQSPTINITIHDSTRSNNSSSPTPQNDNVNTNQAMLFMFSVMTILCISGTELIHQNKIISRQNDNDNMGL